MLLCGVWILAGCAQVGSPDGGGRDEQAPLVIYADPPFGTTEFNRSSFELEFDEFIQLKDARRQMLVSPPLPQPPKTLLRGRRVTVELGEGLLPDRTYIVQFGNAVSDLRESNVAEGLQYVFSTGMALDSGRVSGRAVDAWSGEPVSGARVLLFRDSLPVGIIDGTLPDSLRPLPDYVGLLSDSGLFDVNFLPAGHYGCLVLEDGNGNYRVDEGEALAWSASPLVAALDSAQGGVFALSESLQMDVPPPAPATYTSGMRLDSAGYLRGAMVGLAALREGPDGLLDAEIGIALEGPEGPLSFEFEGDSLWASLPMQEGAPPSPLVVVHPSGRDTLEFRGVEASGPPGEVGTAPRMLAPDGVFSLRFAPVPEFLDTARCEGWAMLDGDTSAVSAGAFRQLGSKLEVGPFSPGSTVELTLLPGALVGLGGVQSDTLNWKFVVRKESDYGSIVLVGDTENMGQDSRLWLLVNGSGLPVSDVQRDSQGRFVRLLPGKYGLVCVDDQDGNGRWSGVDPKTGQMPEPVIRWADGVDVRAGWEVELQIGVLPRP